MSRAGEPDGGEMPKPTLVRKVNDEEIAVITATIERAAVVPIDDSILSTIPDLVVVGVCGCGCATVDFPEPPGEGRSMIIADGIGKNCRGMVSIMVWGHDGAITGLELSDLDDGDPSHLLPWPETIEPW